MRTIWWDSQDKFIPLQIFAESGFIMIGGILGHWISLAPFFFLPAVVVFGTILELYVVRKLQAPSHHHLPAHLWSAKIMPPILKKKNI